LFTFTIKVSRNSYNGFKKQNENPEVEKQENKSTVIFFVEKH